MRSVRRMQRVVVAGLAAVLVAGIAYMPQFAGHVSAAPSLVQNQSNYATSGTSVSVSLSPAATAGHLLVAVCADNVSSTITGPSGFTSTISQSGTVSQGIFYKTAAGGETSLSCGFGTTGTVAIHIYEYSGLHTYMSVETTGSSSGTSTSESSGSVTTTHASDLLFAAIANSSGSGTGSGWSNSFTSFYSGGFGQSGGKPAGRAYFDAGALTVTSAGTYSTAVTPFSSSTYIGQIVAFRTLSTSPALTFDFVDGSGNSVASPSATLGTISPGFSCQTVTGTLGTSTQKFRVTNTTDNPAWTLTMAATAGPTATWYAASTPPHSYKFNDAAGGGCTNGQLTVDASAGTLAAPANCSTAGISKGSSSGFIVGPPSAVTILSAASPAYIDCYFELTGVSLSQKVPAGQLGGSYSIGMTVTITAN